MGHQKIPIFVTDNNKLALRDYIVEKSYSGSWDDWIYDQLKDVVVGTRNIINSEAAKSITGERIKVPEGSVDKVKIAHNRTLNLEGKKTLFTFGPKMFEGLENAYKVDQYIQKKTTNRKTFPTFEEYINNLVDDAIQGVIRKTFRSELDAEHENIKKESDKEKPKTKKKKN